MILSFYDKNFKGLQNNASLVIDNNSYSLIKRGVDLDALSCTCEAFTENIQPTFAVVKNDRGNYVYACLAGIPKLNGENKTELVGSDLKTMLKSDVVLDLTKSFASVNSFFDYVFKEWLAQVNRASFDVQLLFSDNVGTVAFEYMKPQAEAVNIYNAWEDIFAPYLRFYGLFMTTHLDLVEKKVIFSIGKSMHRVKNVKLWEFGIRDYGKWVATLNETQCIVFNKTTGDLYKGERWVLTSKNQITTDSSLRDIFPIKRKVIWKEMESQETDAETQTEKIALLNEGSQEALIELASCMFNENLELTNIQADFETKFNIYVRKGDKEPYKSLPCGELHYNASGLQKVQVGYRFTGIEFIL